MSASVAGTLARLLASIVAARWLGREAFGGPGLLLLGAIVILSVVVLVSTLTALTINRPVHALIRQAEQATTPRTRRTSSRTVAST